MATVRIPTPLRTLSAGEPTVVCHGASVRDVVVALDAAHPGFAGRILDDAGDLRRFVNVFIGDQDIRSMHGLETPVTDADLVSIVPAVAGG